MVAQTPVADLGGVRAGLLDVLAWVLVAFSTILLWPVYALIRKIRGATSHTEP